MIVRREAESALAIGQLSHAWLAGQLARAWGNPHHGFLPASEAIVLGAQQHDIGWSERDTNPKLSADTGLPESFLEASLDTHLSVWRDAPERLMSQSAWAALVVSLHGQYLSGLRQGASQEDRAALQAHIKDERDRQQHLCSALGVSDSERDRIQRQVITWDAISLALCSGWHSYTVKDSPTTAGPVDIALTHREGGLWTLDPWPFTAERLEVQCEGRRLRSAYSDESAMQRDFAQAAPEPVAFTLRASSSTGSTG